MAPDGAALLSPIKHHELTSQGSGFKGHTLTRICTLKSITCHGYTQSKGLNCSRGVPVPSSRETNKKKGLSLFGCARLTQKECFCHEFILTRDPQKSHTSSNGVHAGDFDFYSVFHV